ncbi:amino acid adenylation domain-containing protein [Polymorphospora sp. NPDC050346]|uniref:non-ribosomal peptide synthetase n=1 Tax=Polymorphospora sp. NPDC050346 TaxID=3155780 RepID=UPI00340C1ABB
MTTAEATYAQHAVWFTEQAGVAGTAYHMALGIHFDGTLDERALTEACTAVIARHEGLSSAVETDADGVPHLVPATEKITLGSGPLTDDRVRAEIDRPFDPRRGPLARFTLLTGAPDRHLLLVTAHHLVFDGMSKDVLARDLAHAYDAAVAGRPADLGPAADHSGHAAAERERVAAALPAARDYWAGRWNPPGDVVLPGLTRQPVAAAPGATVEFDLDADLVAGTARLAADLGVSRFELLLAAVHALLHRYGNEALPVGVGLSTRTPDTAGQIGLFVNELPVPAPAPDATFRAYACALRAELRQLYRHRDVPLAQAVSGLRPATALTPVSVGYRRRAPEPAFTGVASRVDWTIFGGTARNALHVQVVDSGTGLTVGLQHSPDAIPTDAVARIGAHLRTLIAGAVADPDRAVDELPILPDRELDLVLEIFNGTARDYAADSLPARFAEQVRQRPTDIALVDGDRELTYAGLEAVSGRLAAVLRDRGVGPGSLVAVGLHRSWTAVATLLAVLRAGAAYLPVDPDLPAARQAAILADAAPALVVTTASATTADVATELAGGPDVLPVDDLDTLPEPAGVPATADPAGTDLAYVLYTSGSTGRPKGVRVPHAALANLLYAMGDVLDSRPTDRWLALTSMSFDISLVEMFLPLATGGRVVVASGVSAADGAAVVRLVETHGVTNVQATPSGWRVLLAAGIGGADRELVALAGGEVLPTALARELHDRVARVVNGYGPTEATIYATTEEVTRGREVTIGRPVANARAYVLDPQLRPLPIGVPGELVLGGAGVADGYLGRPELTADRFRADPYDAPHGRLYRTGDLARWTTDGRLEFLGRADHQVKIRGHRVELGEIETRLLEHPAVTGCAVTLRDGDEGDSRLVGYVVPAGAAPDPAALRAHLAETLPAVMVPATWVLLDTLPLSPSGKLDRAALPAPARERTEPAAGTPGDTGPDDGAAVADEVVEEIRTIWQDVLQIDDIGLDEDLFDLGGHSLTITRISSRIHQRLGVELSLEVFFEMPTIAEIAEVVREARR